MSLDTLFLALYQRLPWPRSARNKWRLGLVMIFVNVLIPVGIMFLTPNGVAFAVGLVVVLFIGACAGRLIGESFNQRCQEAGE